MFSNTETDKSIIISKDRHGGTKRINKEKR